MKSHVFYSRLGQELDPEVYQIVFPANNFELLEELQLLCSMTQAHLIGLHKNKWIPKSNVAQILKCIYDLQATNFKTLIKMKKQQRGSFFLFENYLIDKLGMSTAGSIHMGRSRNDLNATSLKLKLRNQYSLLINNLCQLRATIIEASVKYARQVLPIYSQYQVAQVGTYAYYLLAMEEALSRDQSYFKDLLRSLNQSPLGAGAGCGTSFQINFQLIAKLLGFSSVSDNALDAIADRDLACRMLNNCSILASHLSRLAQDFQLWTTKEFSFFDIPDNLCGGSSMMPQKKNPYLLELIKGKCCSVYASIAQATISMHAVPFSNSIEVGTYAVKGISDAVNNLSESITLTNKIIKYSLPITENIEISIQQGCGIATSIIEMVVKKNNIPFREAHRTIGNNIKQAMNEDLDPIEKIFESVSNLPKPKELIYWADCNEFGGGPGKMNIEKAIKKSSARLQNDVNWIKKIEDRWEDASSRLTMEIQNTINDAEN